MLSFKCPCYKGAPHRANTSVRHVVQAKQTASCSLLCLLKHATHLIPGDNLWPVKHAKFCLFLSTWWWQPPAGHLINHTCHWPPCLGRDCFCLFVFLADSPALLGGLLACPLKAKCESSKLHHLGKRKGPGTSHRPWLYQRPWRLVFSSLQTCFGCTWSWWRKRGGLGWCFVLVFAPSTPNLFIILVWNG